MQTSDGLITDPSTLQKNLDSTRSDRYCSCKLSITIFDVNVYLTLLLVSPSLIGQSPTGNKSLHKCMEEKAMQQQVQQAGGEKKGSVSKYIRMGIIIVGMVFIILTFIMAIVRKYGG